MGRAYAKAILSGRRQAQVPFRAIVRPICARPDAIE
jgi:hypothetical protein